MKVEKAVPLPRIANQFAAVFRRDHRRKAERPQSLGFRVVLEEQVGGTSRYVMAVLIDGKDFGHGEGKSKKSAEQLAAKQACITIFGD